MKIKRILLVGLITLLLNFSFLSAASLELSGIDPEPWVIEENS